MVGCCNAHKKPCTRTGPKSTDSQSKRKCKSLIIIVGDMLVSSYLKMNHQPSNSEAACICTTWQPFNRNCGLQTPTHSSLYCHPLTRQHKTVS